MKKNTYMMLESIGQIKKRMDEKCHDLFLNKEILAPILREVVEEYQDLSVTEIIELIDEASISKLESVSDFIYADNTRIAQTETDLKSVSDKHILFDIHFRSALPEDMRKNRRYQMFMDLEPQGRYYPGYPLVKRGVYYVSRDISRQLGIPTEETDYGILQKCYTIWLCYDPKIPVSLKNTVSRYKLTKEDMFDRVTEEPSDNYDLIEIIMIRLDTDSDSDIALFDYLKGIFTNDMSRIIKYTGALPDNIEKEVEDMYGVGDLIWDKAWDKAWDEALHEERTEKISDMLKRGKTPEEIEEFCGYSMEQIREVQESMMAVH